MAKPDKNPDPKKEPPRSNNSNGTNDPIGTAFNKAVDRLRAYPMITGAAAGYYLRGFPGMMAGLTLGNKKARQTLANAARKTFEGMAEGIHEARQERKETNGNDKPDNDGNGPPKPPGNNGPK